MRPAVCRLFRSRCGGSRGSGACARVPRRAVPRWGPEETLHKEFAETREGDEKDVLGGEGEPERDRASVSFEPSRFGCASAASRCLNQALEKVDGTRRRKQGEGM